MRIPGRVQNGVVVLEGAPALPEGAKVIVSYHGRTGMAPAVEKGRIQVPLVRTGRPGSVNLTGERIAEILDEEVCAVHRAEVQVPAVNFAEPAPPEGGVLEEIAV